MMAQTLLNRIHNKGKIPLFMSLDKVKFRRPVVPGDQLRHEVKLLRNRGSIASFLAKGYVDGTLVAEAEMKAMLVDRPDAEEDSREG